jgi:hypothetical protein
MVKLLIVLDADAIDIDILVEFAHNLTNSVNWGRTVLAAGKLLSPTKGKIP